MNEENTTKSDEEQPFLPSERLELDEGRAAETPTSPLNRPYQTALSVAFLVLSATFIVSGLFNKPSEPRCIATLNYWSPMLGAIQLGPQKAELLDRRNYVGSPTENIERSWDDLWQWGSLGIPDKKLPWLNKSATERDWHHLPEEVGGGVQAFFEGYHHLHCLDLIRKYTYRHEWNYSYVHAFVNEHVDIMEHVEHCLEMLRAKLVCETDMTPYVVVDKPGFGKVVDLGTGRRCRDHDKIIRWSTEHITLPFVDDRDA